MSKTLTSKPVKRAVDMPERVTTAIKFLAQSGYLGYLFGMTTGNRDRDLFKLSLWANLIFAPTLLISIIIIGILLATRPDPQMIGLTRDLRVVDLIPLNEEYVDSAEVGDWVADTTVRTLSLGFLFFNRQLDDIKDCFFDDAYKQLMASLESSQFLPTIRGDGGAQAADSNATLTAPAVIAGKGLVDGKMNWRVELPIVINFEFRGGGTNTQKRLATVIVQRVPLAEHPRGVKIRQFNLEHM